MENILNKWEHNSKPIQNLYKTEKIDGTIINNRCKTMNTYEKQLNLFKNLCCLPILNTDGTIIKHMKKKCVETLNTDGTTSKNS